MYCPSAFFEEDRAKITALIRAYPFGMLVICDQEQAEAMHLMAMLVGFEIDITAIQAVFKFNQNRSEQDRAGVIAALSQSPDANDQAVARLMRAQMDEQDR